jgi:peptidoglycan/xylan/chitin deacetylase (PgdA/CDA1 family)
MDVRDVQARRLEQAGERQLRVRRARFVAFGSLIAVAALAAVIVFVSIGGSGSHAPTAPRGPSRASVNGPTSGSRGTGRPGTATVPILAYNVINVPPAQSAAPPGLYVPADEFSAQMNALKADGWHAVTLDQLQASWNRGVPLGPGKPIVITFDSGYASQYTNALPVLKRLGWVGVEILEVSGLPPSEGGLTDPQVRGLIAAGWELDTEGLTGADLTAVDSGQLGNETAAARQMLRSRYSVPVNWFGYPSGRYDATVITAVRAAGFAGGATVNPGWASPQGDRFRLPRLHVVAGTSPSALLSQIAAAEQNTSAPASYLGQETG